MRSIILLLFALLAPAAGALSAPRPAPAEAPGSVPPARKALSAASRPAGAVPGRTPVPLKIPPVDPATLRADLLAAINRERERAGVTPLALSIALDRVAQERAEEIGKAGGLPGERESFLLFAQVQRRIRQAGYHPHGWTESMTATAGEVAAVVDYWKGDPSFRDAMGADYRDVGIGVASLGEVPLYTFLFAWPEREFFVRQTAPLADLAAVRERMLAAVNAERRKAGLAPLTLEEKLSWAAQKHAEDMLARSYYAHASPEGTSPLARALTAGYPSRRVGENIATGHFSVEEVVDAWMHSSGHRRNILDGAFTQIGVGLAVGRFEDRYRLLWVQEFGTPSIPAGSVAGPSR